MTADERAFVHTAGEDQARDPHFAQQIGSGYLLPAALEQDKVRHCPQALQIIPSPPEGTLKAGTEEQGHTHEQHQNTPPRAARGAARVSVAGSARLGPAVGMYRLTSG